MRKKFVKDYVSNPEGKERFRYTGDYYIFQMEEGQRKQRVLIQCLAAAAEAVLLLAAGMLNSPGSYQIYIVIPYICMILPVLYYLAGSIKLLKVPCRMERYQYEESLLRMMKAVIAGFFLSILTLLGDGVFLTFGQEDINKKTETLFFLLMVALAVINYMGLLYHNRMMKQVQKESQQQ